MSFPNGDGSVGFNWNYLINASRIKNIATILQFASSIFVLPTPDWCLFITCFIPQISPGMICFVDLAWVSKRLERFESVSQRAVPIF